jgi:Fe2+ transport system protein B
VPNVRVHLLNYLLGGRLSKKKNLEAMAAQAKRTEALNRVTLAVELEARRAGKTEEEVKIAILEAKSVYDRPRLSGAMIDRIFRNAQELKASSRDAEERALSEGKTPQEAKEISKAEGQRVSKVQAKKATKSALAKVGLFLVIFFLIFHFVFQSNNSSSNSPSTPAAPASSFTGQVLSDTVIDPATANVQFSITNDGTTAGIPNCSVEVHNTGYSYTGFDSPIIPTPIAPGATLKGNMNITVTGQGASFITAGTVTCT